GIRYPHFLHGWGDLHTFAELARGDFDGIGSSGRVVIHQANRAVYGSLCTDEAEGRKWVCPFVVMIDGDQPLQTAGVVHNRNRLGFTHNRALLGITSMTTG